MGAIAKVIVKIVSWAIAHPAAVETGFALAKQISDAVKEAKKD